MKKAISQSKTSTSITPAQRRHAKMLMYKSPCTTPAACKRLTNCLQAATKLLAKLQSAGTMRLYGGTILIKVGEDHVRSEFLRHVRALNHTEPQWKAYAVARPDLVKVGQHTHDVGYRVFKGVHDVVRQGLPLAEQHIREEPHIICCHRRVDGDGFPDKLHQVLDLLASSTVEAIGKPCMTGFGQVELLACGETHGHAPTRNKNGPKLRAPACRHIYGHNDTLRLKISQQQTDCDTGRKAKACGKAWTQEEFVPLYSRTRNGTKSSS